MASANWALVPLGGASVVAVGGLSGYRMILGDVDNQKRYNATLAGASVGVGVTLGGSAAVAPQPVQFTVDPPCGASAFDNSICTVVDIGGGLVLTASYTKLWIHGVNHNPSPLDIGGWGAGAGAGAAFSPLMYLYVSYDGDSDTSPPYSADPGTSSPNQDSNTQTCVDPRMTPASGDDSTSSGSAPDPSSN